MNNKTLAKDSYNHINKYLKKGDKVITVGGIHGTVAGIKNQGKVIVLKVDKSLNININRSAISGLADCKALEDSNLGDVN